MHSIRRKSRQFHVAVFTSKRASDLIAVFAAIATNEGDAYQQAWDYVRENWSDNPALLEYRAVAGPVARRRRASDG
jgi:hypothetical protein